MILIFLFFIFYVALSTHISFMFWLILFTNIVVSSLMTILAVNPVNSIFFLIALFLNVSIAFFALNLVYLALLLIIVYVGALAIFFLFTLMLLNINLLYTFRYKKTKFQKFLDFLFFIFLFLHFFVFLSDLFVLSVNKNNGIILSGNLFDFNSLIFSLTDLYAHSLYTIYGSIFVLLGLFLFIIMIGVILLIQQNNFLLKSTSSSLQNFRSFKSTLFTTF